MTRQLTCGLGRVYFSPSSPSLSPSVSIPVACPDPVLAPCLLSPLPMDSSAVGRWRWAVAQCQHPRSELEPLLKELAALHFPLAAITDDVRRARRGADRGREGSGEKGEKRGRGR